MTSRCAGRTPLKPPPADGDTSAETAASTSIITPSSNRTVYIATIEKANGIVAHCMETKTFGRFGLVIVDELHMIGSGSRGAILEETMTKIVTSPVGIVGLSATIGNLEEIATFLRGETFVGDFRALPLHEFLQVEGTLYKVHGPEFLKDLGFLNTILSNCGIDKPGDRLRIIKHLIDGDCTTLE